MKILQEARRAGRIVAWTAFAACIAAAGAFAAGSGAESQLAFGVQMAKRGLWNEALFRFREAERLEPGNPRILNNLAVACEAVGQFDDALEYYRRALSADPGNRDLKRNYASFLEFYQGFRPDQPGPVAGGEGGSPAAAGAESEDGSM